MLKFVSIWTAHSTFKGVISVVYSANEIFSFEANALK